MNRFWKVLALCLIFISSGCAAYTPRISKDDKHTPNDAYLYGRFSIQAQKLFLSIDGHQTMGFSLECTNGDKYILRFSKDDPLQVIKIVPSTCSLVEIVYTNAEGAIATRKPAPTGVLQNAAFESGKAYYLGDFFAEATQSVAGNVINSRWRMTSMKDDYATTTQEMKTTFPNLSAVPTENRMIGKK